MKNLAKKFMVGSMLLLGATACANLDVANPNDADASRALATAGDVESLIAGGYNTWFNGVVQLQRTGALPEQRILPAQRSLGQLQAWSSMAGFRASPSSTTLRIRTTATSPGPGTTRTGPSQRSPTA